MLSFSPFLDKYFFDREPKPTRLDVGIFSIVSSTGTVGPGESKKVTVTAHPKNLERQEEIIIFFMSERSPKERKGQHVLLSACGAVPKINFTDMHLIFREMYVIDSYTGMVHVENVSKHSFE